MSTPEQPTPPLTRKQMRELRNTAATPIITSTEPPAEPPVVATPLPRPAAPTEVPPAPEPDASVDLDAHPLTRRQARQQERIRTASVPVITPDLLAAHAAEQVAQDAEAEADAGAEAHDEQPQEVPETDAAGDDAGEKSTDSGDETEPGEPVAIDDDVESATDAPPHADEEVLDVVADGNDDHAEVAVEEVIDAAAERPVVNSALGAELLAGDAAVELPASFDNILARGAAGTGSLSTPNALLLSQTPSSGPLVGPVTATGEVLITGTFALPEGLGSNGHAPGVADGKDVDAVLIDGELPAASSPTPIAASAAVSTSKSAGEIIQPPAPEKGGRLMMALAITAGALALALIGVLVFAITTGVFS